MSQDVVLRDVLWAWDRADGPAIELVDLMARFALDRGFSVVVEGIMHPTATAPARVPGLDERLVGPGVTLEAAVRRVEEDCGWEPG